MVLNLLYVALREKKEIQPTFPTDTKGLVKNTGCLQSLKSMIKN